MNIEVDKGKSTERLRRKAMGLRYVKCYDSQATDFFCFEKGVNFNVKVLFFNSNSFNFKTGSKRTGDGSLFFF